MFVKLLLDGCRDTKGEATHQIKHCRIWVKKRSEMPRVGFMFVKFLLDR